MNINNPALVADFGPFSSSGIHSNCFLTGVHAIDVHFKWSEPIAEVALSDANLTGGFEQDFRLVYLLGKTAETHLRRAAARSARQDKDLFVFFTHGEFDI